MTQFNENAVLIAFALHLATTLFMTGVIWFVQVVHYPLFENVGIAEFTLYSQRHSQRTTWVVMTPMIIELATACWLLWARPDALPAWALWTGMALLALIWLSTGLLQVPQHQILGGGFDSRAHEFLVASNWIRTLAWSIRALLVVWMATHFFRASS